MPRATISMGKGTNMIEFLLFALLAGLGVAAVAGPLGCFVVWRRMATLVTHLPIVLVRSCTGRFVKY